MKYYWIRLLRLHDDPFVLARGVAIGVLVGLTPTIPFHTVLIIAFCTVGRGNVLAGLIASILVSNPLTIPLHYYAAWKLGTMLTGFHIPWSEVLQLMDTVKDAGLMDAARFIYLKGIGMMASMLLGGLALSIPFAIAAYLLSLSLYMKRRRQKLRRYLNYADKPREKKQG